MVGNLLRLGDVSEKNRLEKGENAFGVSLDIRVSKKNKERKK